MSGSRLGGSGMSANQVRMWIFGMAAFLLTVMIAELAGAPPYASAAAAGIAMIAAVFTVRATAGDDPRDQNRRPRRGERIPIRVRVSDRRDSSDRQDRNTPGSFPCD